MTTPVRAVVFDWNGTILDDVDFSVRLLNELLASQGHPPVTKERYTEIFGFPIKDYYVRAGFDFSRESYEALADRYIPSYAEGYKGACRIYPHVEDMLIKLSRGGYKVALLSVSQRDHLADQVEYFGLSEYFDEICGQTDHYGGGKAEMARHLLERMGVSGKETLFVGDTLHDLEVARSVGARCVLVSHGHQSAKRLLAETTDVVQNFSELLFD